MTTRRTRRPVLLAVAALVAVGALALAACSGSSSSKSQTKANGLVLTNAWARTSPMSTGDGVAYVTIQNTTDRTEKLLNAAVPASIAASAEIHETTNSGGMMSMNEVSSIPIPTGSTLTLEPGGFHIMLKDLAAPLKAGQRFTMSLGFMNAAGVQIEVTVKDS